MIYQGHAYTITGLYRVDVGRGRRNKVHLIRVRNPWGDKNEWTGDWSDRSSRWDAVPEKTKRAMGLHKQVYNSSKNLAKIKRGNLRKLQYDGEFWMEFFTDFCREFEEVSICTLGPDFNHDGVVEAAEAVKVTFGEWLPGMDYVSKS